MFFVMLFFKMKEEQEDAVKTPVEDQNREYMSGASQSVIIIMNLIFNFFFLILKGNLE